MILFTSANRIKKYIGASIFLLIFGIIYELFSHGVYSLFMLEAFLFPLIGGVFLPLLLRKTPARAFLSRSRDFTSLYHCGIATLTIGSILQGILEIYGTTNRLMLVFWVVGCALLLLSVITFGIFCLLKKSIQKKQQISI